MWNLPNELSDDDKKNFRKSEKLFDCYEKLVNVYGVNKEQLIIDITTYAQLFRTYLSREKLEEAMPSTPCIERMNGIVFGLDTSTVIPYLLYILHEVHDIDERNKMFGCLEGYLMRRFVCGMSTNNYSDMFSENLIGGNNATTYQLLHDYLSSRADTDNTWFPDDNAVRDKIKINGMTTKRAQAILFMLETRIERDNNNDFSFIFNNTYADLLMPKNWETIDNWKNISLSNVPNAHEVRKMLINSLGNMVLLNTRLSQSQKKDTWIGKLNKILNGKNNSRNIKTTNLLKDVKTWNDNSIKDHCDDLAKYITKYWVL